MKIEQPVFLIATPELEDPNFQKSVVLIMEHSREGAMGVIINKPLNITLGDFARNQSITCHPRLEGIPVYRGGPVQEELGLILHADATLEERTTIFPDLFLSNSNESLELLLEKNHPFHLILGYSGWTNGQLEKEMSHGSWITIKANSKYLFQTKHDEMWDKILRDMGVDPNYLAPGRGVH